MGIHRIAWLMAMTSFSVMAHGGGHFRGYGGHGGYGFGFYSDFPGPFYFPYYEPYYTSPPAVAALPAPPQVYIQQNIEQTIQRPVANYWYYCRNPEGYYPYIREYSALATSRSPAFGSLKDYNHVKNS